ncbi:RNA ligase-domain-containing protein [Biscogniauxia marginata]|nr:RNA ligase-domain-containing protein [Biscogniauxia marginata]
MVAETTLAQSDPKRRLVTIRRITRITPIRGSRHNIVTISGWNVVARRAEGFYENQLVVYFEIDSFLPNDSDFWEYCIASPTKFHDGSIGFLVKTTMIDRHLSQGLVFSMDTFPAITTAFDDLRSKYKHDENTAVQELLSISFEDILGVRKWSVPEESTDPDAPGRSFSPPPVFFPQPGCRRAQNISTLFERHGQGQFQITEKLDGLPMSVYIVQKSSQWYSGLPYLPGSHTQCVGPARVGVCSAKEDLPADEKYVSPSSPSVWFWRTAKQQGILNRISQAGKNVVVQGELCGSSILRNSMGFAEGEYHFYIFNIYNIDKQRYLPLDQTLRICKDLGWDHVPVISRSSKLCDFAKDVEDLLGKAEGIGMKGREREGLVFKELYTDFSFKAISNTWLLETGKK